MSGVSGTDKIEELAALLRLLSARTKGKMLQNAAAAVQEKARAEYAQGKGPPGARGEWPRRKKDDAVALQRPAATVTFTGKAGAIRSNTEGEPHLDHHRGFRPVYPGAGKAKLMPDSWVEAADESLRKDMEEHFKEAPK